MTRTKKLTETQLAVLENGGATGTNVKGAWRWTIRDGGTNRPVTGAVRALEGREFLTFMYFAGGSASASPTAKAREAYHEQTGGDLD